MIWGQYWKLFSNNYDYGLRTFQKLSVMLIKMLFPDPAQMFTGVFECVIVFQISINVALLRQASFSFLAEGQSASGGCVT